MRIRSAATTAVLALLAGLVFATVAAAPALAKSKPCWERVIDDWLDNGTIDARYSSACYQEALKRVPEDLRDYSNITDAIAAALHGTLVPTGGGGTGNGSGNGGSTNPNGKTDRTTQGIAPRSIYQRSIDKLGTTSASSLPVPLLVLAGLGTLLLMSAGGLALHKRLAARSGPPAPPAPPA